MDVWSQAKTTLEQGDYTCVLCKGETVATSRERGIKPILRWLREEPELLRCAVAADKVIGKAAALLFAQGGVSAVWAGILSDAGLAVLEEQGIPYSYARKVAYIANREGNGLCPMEQRVLTIDDPEEAFRIFDELIPQGAAPPTRQT